MQLLSRTGPTELVFVAVYRSSPRNRDPFDTEGFEDFPGGGADVAEAEKRRDCPAECLALAQGGKVIGRAPTTFPQGGVLGISSRRGATRTEATYSAMEPS